MINKKVVDRRKLKKLWVVRNYDYQIDKEFSSRRSAENFIAKKIYNQTYGLGLYYYSSGFLFDSWKYENNMKGIVYKRQIGDMW